MEQTEIKVSPGQVARWLIWPVSILSLITVPMTLAEAGLRPVSWTLADSVRRFTLNSENSVPAWISSLMLFGAAVLLAVCACMYRSRQDKWWKHWAALSGLFCLLSMDESASFHEIAMIPMDQLVSAEGIFYFTWVIPGMAFVAVVGLAFLGFLRHLDRRTRNRFIASAVLFVGGALGMECVDGAILDAYGEGHIAYILAVTVEESMEMFGMVLFIWSLVSHIAENSGEVRLTFNPQPAAA